MKSFKDSSIHIFRHSEIQTFRDSGIQRFRHSEIQTFRDADIQRFRHSEIQSFRDDIQRFRHILSMLYTVYITYDLLKVDN